MTHGNTESEVSQAELLAEGAAALGVCLSFAQLEQFRRYYLELVDWNTRINLTSVTEWEEVQTRHFLDSLAVALVIPSALLRSGRFADIGSGAGFPGMVLKTAFPGLAATLIEATTKKTKFLCRVRELLGLPNIDIRTGRAETLAHDPELREVFDFVLTRAVARMNILAELTLPFCRLGGIVVAQKGSNIADEVAQAQNAVQTMGGRLKEVKEVTASKPGDVRALVVLEKIAPTPERYPRRPGIPAKRPL